MVKYKDQILEREMPAELFKIFNLLEEEVFRLRWQWEKFYNLYGIDERRIELMNKSSGSFFFYIQKGMIENIVISISRLTDPIKTGKHSNLTLKLLCDLVDDDKVKNEINTQFDWYIDKAVKFAREWRRKIYAHKDYDIATGKVELTEHITKENVEMCLKAIRELMYTITLHYRNSRTVYAFGRSDSSDSLLRALENHINVKEYVMNLRHSGEMIPDTLKTVRFTRLKNSVMKM